MQSTVALTNRASDAEQKQPPPLRQDGRKASISGQDTGEAVRPS